MPPIVNAALINKDKTMRNLILAALMAASVSGCAMNGVTLTHADNTPQIAKDATQKVFGGIAMEMGSRVSIGNGWYLTAKHVHQAFITRTGEWVPNPKCDLALYRATDHDNVPVKLGSIYQGQTVYHVGSPALWGQVSTKGVYKYDYRSSDGCIYSLSDATMIGGMSGGGVFNAKGELVGINKGAVWGAKINGQSAGKSSMFIPLLAYADWIYKTTGMRVAK